ncbi:Imm1 family immunity protein [Streptomyces sp. NPDC058685]|uniref:Imm1 family immunity protein n=1 Tax=Streptomyces sp. NPDC058685 TaxID=3346598 RepID=UPI0036574261
MRLAVHCRGERRNLRDAEEVSTVLDELFREGQNTEPDVSATWLILDDGGEDSISMLEVNVNLKSGFGGVVWHTGGREAERIERETGSDIGHYFWVSDAEESPELDPDVLSDFHAPSFFDPRGVLPVAEVRKVIEEYCQLRGSRPTRIRWVAGNQNGTRLD